MDLLNLDGVELRNLGRINILLGKNGCGKSHVLKATERTILRRGNNGAVKYLSPERGGVLLYNPNIDNNINQSSHWLSETRRKNQAGNFKEQSAVQFRKLELITLRAILDDPVKRADLKLTFNSTIEIINKLLDHVEIRNGDSSFLIFDKVTGKTITPDLLSSGESELISLAIECLVFKSECLPDKLNILLIDEPDVHLHPDLQVRLANLLSEVFGAVPASIIIATHSTALVSAICDMHDANLAFMRRGITDITFAPASELLQKVLPIFGAHPLSSIFNKTPIILVEGEDDERVWQQAIRASKGRIKVYPCAVDGLSHQLDFENEVAKILESVYDNAEGYSLRDRDTGTTEISAIGGLRRLKLHCRTIENLLLSDEALGWVGTTWPLLRGRIENWLLKNVDHVHYGAMKAYADSGYDRKGADLKEVRNDLVGLMGTNKPWETIVGKSIASLKTTNFSSETSLSSFLGHNVCTHILKISCPTPATA